MVIEDRRVRFGAGRAVALALLLGCAPSLRLGDGEPGGGGGAGGGGGGACAEEAAACYSGPAETRGVGACKDGLRACDDAPGRLCEGEVLPSAEQCNGVDDDCDGLTDEDLAEPTGSCTTDLYGACREGSWQCQGGEVSCEPLVAPDVERCATPDDENCDNLGGCPGVFLWAKRFGGAGNERGLAVASPDGGVVLAGGFDGSFSFGTGGEALVSAGGLDIFVAKLDASGELLWQTRFGDSNDRQEATDVAIDARGNILVKGAGPGLVDFGGGPLALGGQFLVMLDADGKHVWSKSFPTLGQPLGVALDGAGNALVTGAFEGTLDLGGAELVAPELGMQVFLARFDPAGEHLWSQSFGEPDATLSSGGVAVDGEGNMSLFATLEYGSINFGGTTLSTNRTRCVIARLGPEGQHLFSQSYSAAEYTTCRDIAVDPQGNVLMIGDGETTGVMGSTGKGFMRSVDPSGVQRWAKDIQDNYTTVLETGNHIAADAGGHVLASGGYEGGVDFGGGQVRGGGFLVKFDAEGNHVWTKGLPVVPSASPNARGEVFIAGAFGGELALGDGFTLQSDGGTDLYLAKLTP